MSTLRLSVLGTGYLGATHAAAMAEQFETLARRLADGPTLAYASIKAAVRFSQTHDLAASLEHESELMGLTGRSADHRGAVEAFVAKTPPTFTGR